jgi:hypothetical protein
MDYNDAIAFAQQMILSILMFKTINFEKIPIKNFE